MSLSVCGHSTAICICNRGGYGCLAMCGWLPWANLNVTMPLTSSTRIYLAILCVLTYQTFQKEIDNLGRYGSDQCDTLWCLPGLHSGPGLNSLCRPNQTKQDKTKQAKQNSPHYHLVYRFVRTGKLCPPML